MGRGCLFLVLLCFSVQAADPPALWPKHIEFVTYPQLAKQARIQGKVVLRCWVKGDGSVEKAEVLEGHPLLVQNSKENALKGIFFSKRSGKTKSLDLTYVYQLEGHERIYHSRNTMVIDFPYTVLVRAETPWVDVEGQFR